ncbi:MAG: T9SS type A sorting domain-containing protein [Bacteroidia bacterium]
MKSKLLKLTVAAFMVLTIKTQAQTVTPPATLGTSIFFDGFETWAGTPTQPTVWMQAPATTLPASAVIQSVTTPTNLAAEQGTYACNLQNTTTTYSIMATAATYSVTAGMAYQVSYYVRGKGTISAGISISGTATAPGGESVNGKTWHHVLQSITATASATNTAFFLKVKSTGVYSSGGTSITGIDVDSFNVRPYTPVASVNLYSLQVCTGTNTIAPFWGQSVGTTGGIVTGITVGSGSPPQTGYFLQTTGATQWAAMQVYDYVSGPLVHVGDSVTFGGFVDNWFGQTQMSGLTNFAIVSSGHTINPMLLTTQSINSRMYQSFLIELQGAVVNTYPGSYSPVATITDASGVSAVADLKDGFYPPNGTATSGTTGNAGYVPTVGLSYCFVGNVVLNFNYSIMPRDSGDVYKNCTVLGIEKYNSLNASTYPNPINNQLTIKLPVVANQVSVSFTDVLGKEVMTLNNLSGSEIAISDINVAAGVYIVKIMADGKTQMVKVIKQ